MTRAGDDDPEDAPMGEEAPPDGYAWDFERQERELPPEEYRRHLAILDDAEEEDLVEIDLSRAGDYALWAAAQALDEVGRRDRAIEALRRLDASTTPHPALDYPVIRLRLADLLKERGDYAPALEVLERVERQDPALRDACREQRAEILVLSGRETEGLRLFEKAARRARGDTSVPLAAAWALMQRGRYDEALGWAGRAERELRRAGRRGGRRPDGGEEAARARAEIERLREEALARSERRGAPARPGGAAAGSGGAAVGSGGAPAAPGTAAALPLASLRWEILAALDEEEVRLVARPPRSPGERARARERLSALYGRASTAWDDAVEAGDETLIAAFDDLQGEIAGVAERFGIHLPEAEEAGD